MSRHMYTLAASTDIMRDYLRQARGDGRTYMDAPVCQALTREDMQVKIAPVHSGFFARRVRCP